MADDEKKSAAQPFLSRWSQRKQQAREEPPVAPSAVKADAPVPDLPPVDGLTLESDFSGFMHPEVDEGVRRAALKKLFSDPHFNVMDGLDTYVDDYSKPNVLPAAVLAGLRQAQNILAWAKETKEETAARFAEPAEKPAAISPTEQAPASSTSEAQTPVAPASEAGFAEDRLPAATAPTADAAERKS